MRVADAPRPGWYPDPTGGSQLWWWDGQDWTDHRRAPPNLGWAAADAGAGPAPGSGPGPAPSLAAASHAVPHARDQTAEIMTEVRKAARDEVDRAVRLLTGRARDATRGLEPLISQYGDRLLRWVRNIGIVAIALVVLWVVLQAFVQTSLLGWLGERVDNLFGGWVGVVADLPALPVTGA